MTPSRLAFALIGAVFSSSSLAATADAPQPEFVPLRAKNPAQSPRIEKPAMERGLDIEVRTEMRAFVGEDGQIRFECRDASHPHAVRPTLPTRETK